MAQSFHLPQLDIGLPDKDRSNFIYTSKRSKLKYVYLVHPVTAWLNTLIMWYLKLRTGLDFSGSINDRCAPINIYGPKDCIKIHRDRDMINGGFVNYIAVLTLKEGIGGEFLYNCDFNMKVSPDGKQVSCMSIYNKFRAIKQGEILILKNTNSAHATCELISGQRISLTFRSKP